MKRVLQTCLTLFFLVGFVNCSSKEKSPFTKSDAKKAIKEAVYSMREAHKYQVDLLAHDEYMEAHKLYMEAKNDFADGDEPEEIIETALQAKTKFKKAKKIAKTRKGKSKRILKARKAALKAGVRKSKKLLKSLKEVDENLRDETDLFAQKLEPENFSEFQKKYLFIEAKSVQNKQLGKVRETIQSAKENDASDLAPKTFRAAKLDLKEAENIILRSPRNNRVYGKVVKKAMESAELLNEVLKAIEENGEGTSEKTALHIVKQERKLGSLNSNIGRLKGDLDTTESSLDRATSQLNTKNVALQAKLKKASSAIALQKAMDGVRKNFTSDEAEVYQQGQKIIIRLKKINFASGRAGIPGDSVELLTRVGSIVKDMDPAAVVVQGHTDSTGSFEKNKALSKERASAVANYLTSSGASENVMSVGFGESRPLATNKTREGRALNRRVDIVVRTRGINVKPQEKVSEHGF